MTRHNFDKTLGLQHGVNPPKLRGFVDNPLVKLIHARVLLLFMNKFLKPLMRVDPRYDDTLRSQTFVLLLTNHV